LFRWKKSEIENTLQDKTNDFNEKMNSLKAEETNLIISSAANNTIEIIHENNLARLKQLAYDYHIINKERDEEREEKIKNVFETRVKLNLTMQKMIEAFDKSYRQEEKKKLENEAEIARQKRAQLNLEFDARTKQIESLVKLQQRNYEENCRLGVERDVIIAEIEMQQEKAAQLFEENNVDKITVKELNDIVQENEKVNEKLRQQIQSKQEILKNSNKLENDLNDAIKHRQKLISTVVLSSQNLVRKALGFSSMISSNKASDLIKAAAAFSSGDEEIIYENNNDNEISGLIEEVKYPENVINNSKSLNTIDYDTDIIWNSRREENYQIMSDSIRKFLRKKKRI
jgi:hypothetical protein